MHTCIYTDQSHLTPPSTLQPHTHLPDIPTPVPQGCYVHTWNGCVGLCPSPLFGCCCMHPGCSTVVKHALSPAEQARTSSCALIISLDDFHCPAIDFQAAITIFIKLFFDIINFCPCVPVSSRTPHTRPPTIQLQPTLLGILSPVPRGAMCTARMAGVGSGLHHCIGCHCTCPAAALSSNVHTKPC